MRRVLKRFARCRGGAISVELALLGAAVLIPLTFGAIDGAELVMCRARLDQALQDALYYAWANGGVVTAANVQSNAAASYGTVATQPSVIATITQYCITPATGYPATGAPGTPSNGSCSGGQIVETYLAVTASMSVTMPVSLWFASGPVSMSVSGKARIL